MNDSVSVLVKFGGESHVFPTTRGETCDRGTARLEENASNACSS